MTDGNKSAQEKLNLAETSALCLCTPPLAAADGMFLLASAQTPLRPGKQSPEI